MVYSYTNKIDQINENGAVTCSADQLARSPRRITIKSPIIKISKIKEPNENTVISSCTPLIKSSKYSKNNERHLDPVTLKSKKRKSLLDGSYSHYKKKLTPKSITNEPSNSAIGQRKIKKKKKRNTHIIIWESKLTGAQRVSKRLSNLRTKNKALGKIETLNFLPIAVIKKAQVKSRVQKKTKIPINIKQKKKQHNMPQKLSIVYENQIDSVDMQVQKVYSKKENKTHNRKSSNCITKIHSVQTVKELLNETQNTNSQLEDSTDVKVVSSMCSDTNDVEKMDSESILMAQEEQTFQETGCIDETDKDVDKINSGKTTELIHSQNVTVSNETKSENTMDVFQEECFNDSEVIIVELVGNLMDECVDSLETERECGTDSDKKDTQTNFIQISESLPTSSTSIDSVLEDKSKT